VSPFEYSLGDSGGSLQLAAMSGQIKWPVGPNPPYPDSLKQFVTWMLQPQPTLRPSIGDVCIHIDKLIAKFPTGDDALRSLQSP
jgi:serine/threonine kinase 16